MATFYKKGNLTIDFAIVFARILPTETQDETNIIANFSAKTLVRDGKEEIEMESINNLTLRQSREGDLFIASPGSDQPIGANQRRIYTYTPFPGSQRDEKQQERYRIFVRDVVKEIESFVRHKKEAAAERDANRQPNPALKGLRDMAPQIRHDDREDGPF